MNEEINTGDSSPALVLPGLSERIQAIFADSILIILLMIGFAEILSAFSEVPDWIRIVLFLGLYVIYEPFCISFSGATVGHYLLGIRVRSFSNPEKNISLMQAYIRYFCKLMLGWISFLTVHRNEHQRAIHDFAGGSIVIRKTKTANS